MKRNRGGLLVADWLRGRTEDDPRTQVALAARVSARVGRRVSQSTISAIAHCESVPRGDLIVALHLELGIPVDAWFVAVIDESSTDIAVNAHADALDKASGE
jgi:transcriptional regulator with XRE-family HTH domain